MCAVVGEYRMLLQLISGIQPLEKVFECLNDRKKELTELIRDEFPYDVSTKQRSVEWGDSDEAHV